MGLKPNRRELLAGAALAGGSLSYGQNKTPATRPELPPGMKLSVMCNPDPSDQDLQFITQLGVEYVNFDIAPERATYENFVRIRQKVEAAGLKVWNIGNSGARNMEEVVLNLPGRDQKIEEYKQYLRNLAKAGLYYTTYAHMANGIWSTSREPTRGGAMARSFDMEKGGTGSWRKKYEGPLTHGRRYTPDELWENYTYFIKAVVPVAEEVGVRIGCHPDDPPGVELGGIPRCIFGTFDGYVRALEIANSPSVGVCLCCGCWLEGGALMGKDLIQAVRYFGRQGKLFKVHFQAVSSPLPRFTEVFIDDCYVDYYDVLKALREVNYNGVVWPTHVPAMVDVGCTSLRRDGGIAGTAYYVGYVKALLRRVNAEAGGSGPRA